MRNIFIVCLLGILSACSATNGIKPEGEFFASIFVTESALSGDVKEKEGFAFYIEGPEHNSFGPFLNGYKYENGTITEAFDLGGAAADYINKINNLKLEPFNYELELNKAVVEAKKDYPMVVLGGRDGAKWEFRVNTDNGEFYLHKWNLEGEIELLSPYSENISKLNEPKLTYCDIEVCRSSINNCTS